MQHPYCLVFFKKTTYTTYLSEYKITTKAYVYVFGSIAFVY